MRSARPTMPMPESFEAWDCSAPILPARSRLYTLPPIGIGTSLVESLCSYVVRLADAHAVSVGDLVGRELSQAGEKPLVWLGRFMRQHRAASHGFHARANAINGTGETARRWINAIERATLQNRLRFLTLAPFEQVFSRQGVPRGVRAWCSACYEEQKECGEAIYDPLLWTVALVSLCPRHLTRLEEECPHCHSRSMPLAVYSRPGHCSHCQEWLGKPVGSADRYGRHPEAAPDAALMRAQAIGDLIRMAPALDGVALHRVWIANLKACIETVVNGSLGEIAKRLDYKGADRLYQVDRDLCKRLAANYRRSGRSHGWRKKGGKIICEQVDLRMLLEESLALDEPVSAHHIAARIGYANDGYLQRKFPDLCRAIRRKIAVQEAERRVAMERLLTEALNEEPPPTLNDLRARAEDRGTETKA